MGAAPSIVRAVVCGLLVGPAAVSLAEAAETADVHVEASGACADQAAFERAVRARSSRIQPRAGASDRVRLVTRSDASGAEGELEVLRAPAPVVRRVVSGARCDEVVAGLAFVAALAFDPGARPPEPEAPRPSPEPAAPAPAPLPPSPAPRRDAPPTAGTASGFAVGPELVARGVMVGLGFDGPALGAGAELGLRLGRSPLPATVRAGVVLARGDRATAPATASVGLVAARLELCSPGLRPFASLGAFVAACAAGLGGSLGLSPGGVSRTVDASRAFGAVEAGARLAAPLARWLTVEVQPGVLVPLVRDRFFVEGLGAVYRAPAVAPALALALAGHFP